MTRRRFHLPGRVPVTKARTHPRTPNGTGGTTITVFELYLELNHFKKGPGGRHRVHIFPVSAAMVGVCLTVIGLIRMVITVRGVDTLADDLLVLDAILFLNPCLLSYWAMRTRSDNRLHRIERTADGIFVLGLLMMVGVCGVIVYRFF